MYTLKNWLGMLSMSQAELSRMAGVNVQTLNKYVLGSRTLPDALAERIAALTDAQLAIEGGVKVFTPKAARRKPVTAKKIAAALDVPTATYANACGRVRK